MKPNTKKARVAEGLTNTFLAETWEEKGERVADRRNGTVKITKPTLPAGGVLTCVVDVQKDRLEFEVMGWGIAEESWGILPEQFMRP